MCARLGIHLIFCRPYAPEGKGKLERWHRTFRDQFLSELDERHIADLADLNARLWAWIEQVYHQAPHAGLNGLTPLARYQRDLPRIRSLGAKAVQLDSLFLHRINRFVRKDATVSYLGQRFEVPYELSGKTVHLVVDPHAGRVVGVEDGAGISLGAATPLDLLANIHRTRRKPEPLTDPAFTVCHGDGPNLVELAHAQYHGLGHDRDRVLQHFGLRHPPLSKSLTELWDDGVLAQLGQRFNWLLQSPGIGLLTGEPGVGKTAALRSLTQPLNPHRYQVLYQAETDFGRVDIYRSLARELGLEPSYRRAQLWRDIKQRVHEMVDSKQLTPLWIIDEAQNLPAEFFRDFPSFLNFAFDSRDLMTVWLVGHPVLAQTLERAPYAALRGRIQVHVQLKPVLERERFALLIAHALKSAGSQHNLLADTGMEILRQASKGLPRQAGRILSTAMRLAVPKGLNHLPDEILQQAITELQ